MLLLISGRFKDFFCYKPFLHIYSVSPDLANLVRLVSGSLLPVASQRSENSWGLQHAAVVKVERVIVLVTIFCWKGEKYMIIYDSHKSPLFISINYILRVTRFILNRQPP